MAVVDPFSSTNTTLPVTAHENESESELINSSSTATTSTNNNTNNNTKSDDNQQPEKTDSMSSLSGVCVFITIDLDNFFLSGTLYDYLTTKLKN